jgi:steroid delta-isomerase-like uncharacterized protein
MSELDTIREAVVREHMESENRHDFDTTIGTFDHPRYELVGTGEIYDGEAEVRRYFAETRTAFPDQRNRILNLYPSRDAVIAEFVLAGTHRGRLRGLPPTNRAFECPMLAIFAFAPGTSRITCERVYFDASTILRQLGLATDPRSLRGRLETAIAHPLTVGGALLRGLGPTGR